MEWISSLLLTGYSQIRSGHGYSASFSYLRLFHIYWSKSKILFYAYIEKGCSASLTIARKKQT